MAALPVSVQVTSVSINAAGNNYEITVQLAPGDTSGLSYFQMNWQGPGLVPRYAIGAIATLDLP